MPAPVGASSPAPTKMLVVVEENKTYEQVLGSGRAPYLDALAETFGNARAMNAGYPTRCPSLAAYVILTSGEDHGICDNRPPAAHALPGDSVFARAAAGGGEWRLYGEGMPQPCSLVDSADRRFVVRHAPAAYYVDLREQCRSWSIPAGTLQSGVLREDVAAGRLPELSFVIPDICHDMHGGSDCSARDDVRAGDDWLREWLPTVFDGPDYRAGDLVVVITWDEGSRASNHTPTVVVSPRTDGVEVDRPTTLCGLLATMSEVLAIEPMGCAASTPSFAADFGLR